ncbi:HEAT repeat domain-containing protein [Corallococcus aberystwythensis]|uniref:HEAT repeat domain-containing protein n=1 Tax=Corallococcus aberystwythensis TaxID=2316722 RepID=UPI00131565FB|nr:HEAT repeat domain-containing protein [Corallococcus aberystwythensis]
MWLLGFSLVFSEARATSIESTQGDKTPPRVLGWLASLDDGNDEVALQALEFIGEGSLKRQPAIRRRLQSFIKEPRFGRFLNSSNPHTRERSLNLLLIMGEHGKAQASRLREMLVDPETKVRELAARALRAMGSAGEEQIAILGASLKDPNAEVRGAAAFALAAMEGAAKSHAPSLSELLKDPDDGVRGAAVMALMALGTDARTQAPQLGALLLDPNAKIRMAAAQALMAMGEEAREQAPRLGRLLSDSEPSVREAAAHALMAMRTEARGQVHLLAGLVHDPNAGVRMASARALGAMGVEARAHVLQLAILLNDPDAEVRAVAAGAMGSMGAAAGGQVERLVTLLTQDENYQVRRNAAGALGELGDEARRQVPRLEEIIPRLDADLRVEMVTGAAGRNMRMDYSYLLDVMTSLPVHERAFIMAMLIFHSEFPVEQAPRLVDLLAHPEDDVRMAVAGPLRRMGPKIVDRIPRLIELLENKDEDVRRHVLRVLESMGEAAQAAVDPVGRLLKDSDKEVREQAAKTLAAMGDSAKTHAPQLNVLAEEDDATSVRLAALEALGAMRELKGEHAPMLLAMLAYQEPFSDVKTQESLQNMFPSMMQHPDTTAAEVHARAGTTLASMAPLGMDAIAAILAMASKEPQGRAEWLVRAHIAGGGVRRTELLLQWLVGRTASELPQAPALDDAREALMAFNDLWPYTKEHAGLRDDLAQQIARVTSLFSGRWSESDVELLAVHAMNLQEFYPMHAENLRSAIGQSERWRKATAFFWVLVTHSFFWILLLYFYPRFPQVQAFFFWSPWVRRFTGFGYVGLLLTWVPFLRRRLLSPFKYLLVADAELAKFDPATYFKESMVSSPVSRKTESLTSAIPQLKGPSILEGASGLGAVPD